MLYSLKSLRFELIKQQILRIHLKNPIEEHPNINLEMLKELIEFLFSKVKIQVVLVNKPWIIPKNIAEIQNILAENRSSSLAGHSVYLRTYKRMK